jgi:hypothetical protein
MLLVVCIPAVSFFARLLALQTVPNHSVLPTMATQPTLFHDSLEEALREVIQAAGGAKVVACLLWPDKTPDAAHRLLLACMNEDRPERFNPGHLFVLLRLGREKGCHAAMQYLNAECGYQAPVPIEPEDERARLQRDYIDAVSRLERLQVNLSKVSLRVA